MGKGDVACRCGDGCVLGDGTRPGRATVGTAGLCNLAWLTTKACWMNCTTTSSIHACPKGQIPFKKATCPPYCVTASRVEGLTLHSLMGRALQGANKPRVSTCASRWDTLAEHGTIAPLIHLPCFSKRTWVLDAPSHVLRRRGVPVATVSSPTLQRTTKVHAVTILHSNALTRPTTAKLRCPDAQDVHNGSMPDSTASAHAEGMRTLQSQDCFGLKRTRGRGRRRTTAPAWVW
jgi:hypothetical protein